MKKFVLKVGVFTLPILIFIVVAEVSLRKIPNQYSYKKSYLDNNANAIKVLILGSSHSFFGVNPIYFDFKAFNAAHISQSLDYDYLILDKYKNKLNNLEFILIPISYFSLNSNLKSGIEEWRTKKYEIYYQIPKKKYNSFDIFTTKGGDLQKRIMSYYFSEDFKIGCTSLGWGTQYNSKAAQDLIKTGKSAAYRHTKNIHSKAVKQIFKQQLIILNQFVDFAKENNINILFFTPPAYETYRKELDKKQLQLTMEAIRNLTEKNEHIKYLDFLSDSNFVAQDFYDADHLSEIGAEKFSIILNDYIVDW